MKTAVISIKELTKDNPDLCMSPLRVIGECHKCERIKGTPIERIERLSCKPRIPEEAMKLLERKAELLKELREINILLNL